MDTSAGWQDWSAADAREWIAVPSAGDDKYSRGVLGVLTGSDAYPGAAVLGVEAAVRTGVGMVRYLGEPGVSASVLARRPEVVTVDGRVQAWLVGSGTSAADRAEARTAAVHHRLAQGLPNVVDAGALDLATSATGPVLVTPHLRELVALFAASGRHIELEAVREDPAAWCFTAAEEFGITVLLKGGTTYVADAAGTRLRVTGAPAWLATAGSGDVLGGVLGALVATHSDAILAGSGDGTLAMIAATGAVLHAAAGERASGGGPLAALDIAENVPAVIAGWLAD